MSRRREILQRIAALDDIAGIMGAMQALAVMETQRLREVLANQQGLFASLAATAAEFLAWYPQFATTSGDDIWLLLGAEQGFCGDFNDSLRIWLRTHALAQPPAGQRIVIGRRLADRLPQPCGLVLPGATVGDEVPRVLQRLSAELARLFATSPGIGLCVLHHDDARGTLHLQRLLPLRDLPAPRPRPFAPRLNLDPAAFFAALTGEYLYAALNTVCYSSLMAENRQRLAHMDHAVRQLDEDRNRLRLRYNARRQEEITEEIEMILLSAEQLASP